MTARSRLTRIAAGALLLLGVISAPMFAQTASFSGTVLIAPTEKPLANAEILFTGLNRSVRSDSAGNFLFAGLPLGKHAVVVKMLGYESINTDVTLTNGRPVSVDLLLKPTTTKLAKVEVTAAAPYAMRLVEFEDRRKVGTGRFLTADFFEHQQGRPLSSFLMQKIPGLNFVQAGSARIPATNSRGGRLTGSKNGVRVSGCFAQVIVNGIVQYDGDQPLVDIDEFNSLEVVGFEFYTTATTPSQYNKTRRTSGCGTVIIWTK